MSLSLDALHLASVTIARPLSCSYSCGDGLGDAGGRCRRAGLHGHHHVQRDQVLHHEVVEDLAVILGQFLIRGVAEELDDLRLEAVEASVSAIPPGSEATMAVSMASNARKKRFHRRKGFGAAMADGLETLAADRRSRLGSVGRSGGRCVCSNERRQAAAQLL
jgi:hypothetical protein